ncbi:hypothetical protein DPX16_20480 [Anabarilius grahami]|uniref:Uncharacterized protein n=1 Tax=Anabarilius grahami TaxID=495550 RepID=A0A3N0Z4F0_ANAGA|nr:hypothetical protein DPX16_20480 [Anabarilius grahami]
MTCCRIRRHMAQEACNLAEQAVFGAHDSLWTKQAFTLAGLLHPRPLSADSAPLQTPYGTSEQSQEEVPSRKSPNCSRKKSPTAEKRVSIKACLTRPRCLEGVKRGAKTWRGQVANTSVYWSMQQPSSSCFLDLSVYRGCARTCLEDGTVRGHLWGYGDTLGGGARTRFTRYCLSAQPAAR